MKKSDPHCDILRIDCDVVKAGVMFINITGSIDAHTYEEIEEYLDDKFSSGASRIVFDLGQVRYMSSAGIGVFVGALARARQAGGDLLLMNLCDTVKGTLEVLGLMQMFFVAPDRNTAVAYFERQKR